MSAEMSASLRRLRKQHHRNRLRTVRRRRLLFWGQIAAAILLFIVAGLTIRAIELTTMEVGGVSWADELKQGHYAIAFDKFSEVSALALERIFTHELSGDELQRQFRAALPHLKRAGYSLTELEVEVGIPPKLIPHFHHDRSVRLNLDETIAAMGDNSIGVMLINILARAGELQGQLNVGDLPFDDIEVELGPIPSLKLQYLQRKTQQAVDHGN